MDHNETSTFTPFDYMTQTRELQMLKTMLPYMKDTQKKQFAILIKYMEAAWRHWWQSWLGLYLEALRR